MSLTRPSGRHRLGSPFWAQQWKGFVIPITASFVLLQLLFLAIMCYMYGVFFKTSTRAHAIKVLAVDYDGAAIGRALQTAYQAMKSNAFPSVEFHTPKEYPSQGHLDRVVCKGDYWAVIHAHEGASARLMQTINGTNTTMYNPADAISFSYNGAAYPVIVGTMLDATMKALTTTASKVLYGVAPELRAVVNMTDPVSFGVFLNPIQPYSSVIAETGQGSRVFFNTVSMVMPQLMQFFFIMALNNISIMSGVLTNLSKRDVYLFRLFVNKLFGLVAALCMAGYLWAFRESWGVNTGQFFETCMCLWLFMDINFLLVDSLIDVVIPISFWSFFMVTWIIINVASTIAPFELSPGFYRWGNALPAHQIWTLLITIWSGGCRNRNKVALPVLFAWWVVGHFTSAWSVRRRCMMHEKKIELEAATADSSSETLSPPKKENEETTPEEVTELKETRNVA